jgi:hypothetical protein
MRHTRERTLALFGMLLRDRDRLALRFIDARAAGHRCRQDDPYAEKEHQQQVQQNR